jgi:SAM-dependent methyltransferase
MGGKLYAAPMETPLHVLDIATGTGLWAIEVAQENPHASVIGTDLSAIQATNLAPNCKFFVHDCEDEWHFPQKFDLIHGRALLSCFFKPRTVISSIFSALLSNGYFELQDICFPCKSPDGTLSGTSIDKWQSLIIQGLRNLGKDFEKVKEYGSYMREAGFVDVVETKYTWAIGPWIAGKKEKIQGKLWGQNFLDGIHGWSMAIITRGMKWEVEEVEKLLEEVRMDVGNWREMHVYVEMYVVYGRKP